MRDKTVDPYWSLWGKLKAQHKRDLRHYDEMYSIAEYGVNILLDLAEYADEEYHRRRAVLVLPLRREKVEYDGECLIICGKDKVVTNDRHAVNALRKLDTNDDYWTEFLKSS